MTRDQKKLEKTSFVFIIFWMNDSLLHCPRTVPHNSSHFPELFLLRPFSSRLEILNLHYVFRGS